MLSDLRRQKRRSIDVRGMRGTEPFIAVRSALDRLDSEHVDVLVDTEEEGKNLRYLLAMSGCRTELLLGDNGWLSRKLA